jgi:hypothetical protein
VDFSKYTDEELKTELEAIQFALRAPVGRPFDGQEARLRAKMAAFQAEMEKRDTPRP